MKKMTKLSAAALLALLLTACDKPAEKTASAEKAPAAQQQEAAKPAEDTGAADYKAYIEWQRGQEAELQQATTAAVHALGEKAKDQAAVQDAINKAVVAQVEKIKQSAAAFEVKNEQVKALKEKSIQALSLGMQIIAESEKVQKAPSEEGQKAVANIQKQLEQIVSEGQKIEAELKAKYAPAPAPQAAPAPAQQPAEQPAPAQQPAQK